MTAILVEGRAAGVASSTVRPVESEGAESDTFEQYRLVERLLERRPDVDYLIGVAPAAESAPAVLALRPALAQGRLLAAPFDWPRLQGGLAVEYAVRAREGALDHRQIGPRVTLLTAGARIDPAHFAPPDFEPSFDME